MCIVYTPNPSQVMGLECHTECPYFQQGLKLVALSAVSDFQCYVLIRSFAIDIISIEFRFASAFQYAAFSAHIAIVQAFPFIKYIVQTLFTG